MLIGAKHLQGFKLGAIDGEIGHIREFYLDDDSWTVRYLVADTGNWLPGRQVLISPFAVSAVHLEERIADVQLTREKVEHSPPITMDMPVSRQYEMEFYRYYGWPMYWYGPALWGPSPYPVYGHGGTLADPIPPREEEGGDPHLRSSRALHGYHLAARDGEIGHLDDFLLDDADWSVRYLVAATRNWWPGKKVLIAPEWIQNVNWDHSSIDVDLLRATIQGGPEFQPDRPLTRADEVRLYEYYQREGYWKSSDTPGEPLRQPR